MITEFVNRVRVTFLTLKEANEAIAFMRAKLKESIGHWVSVYDLIGCCSLAPDFAYRFTSGELNEWGWTSIDGFSLNRGPIRGTHILTMPPARKRWMINPNLRRIMEEKYYPLTPPPEPYIPRKDGKSMKSTMEVCEEICRMNELREDINNKIKHYCESVFYGYEHILEYQHSPSEKRYRLVYMIPFDSSCFIEMWPDEKVDAYLNEQENKARKELVDRVIKDINKGDANNMPIHMDFDFSNFDDYSQYAKCLLDMTTTSSARVRLPKIANIEMYNDRVVKVTFDDGSFTKSVCQENDIFDLDVGITVCLMKKMLDSGKGDGTRIYNDIIRDAHKLINDKENEKIEQQMEKEKQNKKKRKAQMKRQAKKLKAKEEAIDIQKQAFVRALQETGMTGNVE